MGADSVTPFLEVKGKWVILLVHTSNPGSSDFQLIESKSGKKIVRRSDHPFATVGSPDQLMYVVGATRADTIGAIRKLAPDHFSWCRELEHKAETWKLYPSRLEQTMRTPREFRQGYYLRFVRH